jgi:hypothetical protein
VHIHTTHNHTCTGMSVGDESAQSMRVCTGSIGGPTGTGQDTLSHNAVTYADGDNESGGHREHSCPYTNTRDCT